MNFDTTHLKKGKESQNAYIWRQLKAGKRITSYWAFKAIGCTRLASRIHDLRRLHPDAPIKAQRHPDGYNIYYLQRNEKDVRG